MTQTDLDLGEIDIHEASRIDATRRHRCRGCSTLVTVESNGKKVYTVHWSS